MAALPLPMLVLPRVLALVLAHLACRALCTVEPARVAALPRLVWVVVLLLNLRGERLRGCE